MATPSNSGGKILRNRRIPSRTPYSRPPPEPAEEPPTEPAEEPPTVQSEPDNPNWLSGLVISPAKMLVSGAGKFLSFFGPDSSSSSSDEDDDVNDNDDLSENDDEYEVMNDVSFERNDQPNKESLAPEKSDKKSTIEQLVTQETFSRSEGNKLIKLITSRVADTNGNSDEIIANIHPPANKQARKWLQQKRSGSKKKEHEFDNQIPATPFNMKQRYLSSGSWNIMEEIRRVRSKTTRKQLDGAPVTNTGLSSMSRDVDQPQDSLVNTRAVEGTDLESNEVNNVNEPRSRAAKDGFFSTSSGLIGGRDARTLKRQLSEEVNGYFVGSSQIAKDIYVEQNSNPEVEPAGNISNATHNDSSINRSQNSSSMHPDDPSWDLGQPNVEHTSKAKAKSKPRTKNAPNKDGKSRVYSLRGRERRSQT